MSKEQYLESPDGKFVTTGNPEVFSEWRRIPAKEGRRREVEQATLNLRDCAPDGSHLYGIVVSVSRSGMSRTIRLFAVCRGDIADVTSYVSCILGWRRTDDGVVVKGCGMDMLYHTVECLNNALGSSYKYRRL